MVYYSYSLQLRLIAQPAVLFKATQYQMLLLPDINLKLVSNQVQSVIYNQAFMNSYHYLFKFIVIGDTGVGKSCVVLQFIENKTRLSHDVTIGVQFGAKTIKVENKNVKLQIWDTAGQENFRSITRSYYRSAIGALLVYDITKKETFYHVKDWLEEVKVNGNQHMEILLVGNKNDLENQRAVSYDEGYQFAQQNGLNFVEISAKDYAKVSEAFQIVANNIYKRIEDGRIPLNVQNIGVKIGDQSKGGQLSANKAKKNSGGCC